MTYELLYSRTIAGDSVIRYTDVPITNRNVMIEVLSLLSPFRRIAGYAYALRSDGLADYERSGGVTLPFGKNRVNFALATVPYGLEFFPKWGMKTGIISVYIGEPSPPNPFITIPGTSLRCYRDAVTGLIMVSPNSSAPFSDVGLPPCVGAFARSDSSVWLDISYPNYGYAYPGVWAFQPANEGNYNTALSELGSIVVPSS